MTTFSLTSNPTIRVGAISFVNTVPIYSAYEPIAGSILHYDVPAALNAQVRAGELDISPVSSACYLREKEHLVLLSDLSVSSSGAVESVIFLSKVPLGLDLLELPHINVPNDSETSVMLLAHLLEEATGEDCRAKFQVYEAADYQNVLQRDGNALVIGDHALLIQAAIAKGDITGFRCYDLSTLWKEKTGLPFVFAVWVANKSWAEQYPEQLLQVNQALRTARNLFYEDKAVFEAGLQLAQQKSGLLRGTLERYYYQCLEYKLDEAHHQCLQLFDGILGKADNRMITASSYEEKPLIGSL